MDSALETYLTSKSDVSGFLCIDANGLVISGQLHDVSFNFVKLAFFLCVVVTHFIKANLHQCII